jgi:hypothetical protein
LRWQVILQQIAELVNTSKGGRKGTSSFSSGFFLALIAPPVPAALFENDVQLTVTAAP